MDFAKQFWIISTVLFWILGLNGCHEIVSLVVPFIADPRENVTLSCRYRMGRDYLYSAKWYKDDHEIFRYMPAQKRTGLSFPVEGITLAKDPICSDTDCDIVLTNLVPLTEANYRCEVSSEAPTFFVVEKSSNMSIAALPKTDPRIDGISGRYSIGDEIKINCTSDPTLPPWELKWFINDVEPSFLNVNGPWTSAPDHFGLTRTIIGFRKIVDKSSFLNGKMKIKCAALAPFSLVGGPHMRETILYTSQYTPSFLDLAWSSGTEPTSRLSILCTTFNYFILITYINKMYEMCYF